MKYDGEVITQQNTPPVTAVDRARASLQNADVGLPTQAFTSFARGMTYGNFDELMGKVAPYVINAPGLSGEDISGLATGFTRDIQNQFATEHPYADFGLRFAGGTIPLINPWVSAGFKSAPLTTGAVTSGAVGGLTGIGEAEDYKTIAGLTGLALGAPMGLMTTFATQLLMQKGLPAMARLSEMTRSTREKALDMIRPFFQAGHPTTSSALSRARQLGTEATVTDIGGKPTQALTGELTTQDMGILHTVDKLFNQRARGAATRLNQSVTRLLGIKGRNFLQTALNISNKRKLEAGPLYEQASKETIPIQTIDKYLQNLDDLIARTENTGYDTALKAFRRGLFRSSADGRKFVKQDVDSLIYARKSLGDAASKAFRNGEKDKWMLLKDARDKFDSIMPQSYRDANAIWSSETQLNDAMMAGRKFLSEDADLLSQAFDSMSQAEKEHYLIGAVRAISDKMGSVQEGGKVTTWLNKPVIRDKLKLIFPDDASLATFMRDVERENVFTAAKNFVMGNSMTHFRQQASKLFDTIQSEIPGSKAGIVSTLIDRLKLDRSMNPEVKAEVVKILTTQGPTREVIEALMRTPLRSELPDLIRNSASMAGPPTSALTGIGTGNLSAAVNQ